jgi:diguanylate cyclase (GGDEF)-like protein
MQCAVSSNEAERLAALKRYNILDTPQEESFDRITRLAKTVLGTRFVLLSLVDKDRVWFKSGYGFDAAEIPRSIAFCAHTIQQNAALIIRNAPECPSFRNNPMVVGAPHICFYIGVPLRTQDGHNIGTLCALDTQLRELSNDQVSALRDLARLAVDEMELRQIGTTDPLTGVLTRRGFEIEIDREMNRVARYQHDFSLIVVDIEQLKVDSDSYDQAERDLMLQIVGADILKSLRKIDFVGRLGASEFVLALPETGFKGAQVVAERMRLKMAQMPMPPAVRRIHLTASFGISSCVPTDDTWETALARANAALKKSKERQAGSSPICMTL